MNMMLQLLFTCTIAGSSVVICQYVLRSIFSNARLAKLYDVMGKIALAFYLLPVALCMKWVLSLLYSNTSAVVEMIERVPGSTISPFFSSIPLSMPTNMGMILIGIWGMGVIIFAGWQLYCYRRFITELDADCMDVPENSEAARQLVLMKDKLGMESHVQLTYSAAIRSPILVGLWKPTIYLPVDHCAGVDMGMVIHHELVHLKRKDIWFKMFALVVHAIHWFNPLAYILRRDIHQWSEFSCDEEVVAKMSMDERKQYGATILGVMIGTEKLPVQFCSTLSDEGKQLKRRLEMMLHVKKVKRSTMILMMIAVIAVVGIGTSTAVWASAKVPEMNDQMVEETVGKQVGNDEGDIVSEKATEIEWVPIKDATEEQIKAYQQQFSDASDVEFWEDVEEDKPESIGEMDSSKITQIEAEEIIYVEVK